jgi:hypothetical protein
LLNSEYFMHLEYFKGDGTANIKYTLKLTFDTNVGPMVIYLMMAQGNSGITSRAGLILNITVDKLLDVDYSLEWDATLQNLRPLASGTMQGEWSTAWEVQGPAIHKALDIPVGRDGLHLWVLQDRISADPDLTQSMASVLPATLSGDTSDQIVQVAKALRGVHVRAMTMVLGYVFIDDGKMYGHMYGLKANGADDVNKMLGWFINNSVMIANFGTIGMLDLSTIGTAASEDLGLSTGVKAVLMDPMYIVEIPLLYYEHSSQLYQVQRYYPPLYMSVLDGMTVTGTTVSGYTVENLEYTIFSETLLKDPEVNYG